MFGTCYVFSTFKGGRDPDSFLLV